MPVRSRVRSSYRPRRATYIRRRVVTARPARRPRVVRSRRRVQRRVVRRR